MKRVLVAIVTVLMVTSVDVGGGNSTLAFQDNHIKIIKPVVNENGWKIPGLEGSQTTSARKALVKGFGPTSVPMHVTVFRPSESSSRRFPFIA